MGLTIVTYFKVFVRILVKICEVHGTVLGTKHPQYLLATIVYKAFHMYYLIYSSLMPFCRLM